MNVRIIIGNHHFITRRRLETIITRDYNLELLGSYDNGAELYNQIIRRQPDLVILNPTMPGVDSLRLIEMIRREPKYDIIHFLLVGATSQKKLLEFLDNKTGVCYISYENSDEAILKAIHTTIKQRGNRKAAQLFTTFPEENASDNLQLIITEIMHELGVPAHIKGYMYLRSALMIAVENMEVLNAVTKQLYPEIAKMYNTTPSRVERAIRHAIETAWNRSSEGTMQLIFGYNRALSQPEDTSEEQVKRTKPTNSEFIALLADKIRLEVFRNVS